MCEFSGEPSEIAEGHDAPSRFLVHVGELHAGVPVSQPQAKQHSHEEGGGIFLDHLPDAFNGEAPFSPVSTTNILSRILSRSQLDEIRQSVCAFPKC